MTERHSPGHAPSDSQEPTLPPLAFNRPADAPDEATRLEDRPVQNLGQSLQAARHAKGLTAGDLAQSLNLDLRIVTVIEANRFEEAPEPIYVRAYLKHWASLLGADPAPWIAAYNDALSINPEHDPRKPGIRPPLEVMTSKKGARSVHHRTGKGRGMLWRGLATFFLVVVIAIVALIALPTPWQQWLDTRLSGHAPQEHPVGQTINLRPPSAQGRTGAPMVLPLAPPESSTPAPTVGGAGQESGSSPAPDSTALPPPSLSSSATTEGNNTGDNSTGVMGALPAQPLPAKSDASASTPVASNASAPVTAGQMPSYLVIKATTADCWVEVRNAEGKRLVYDVLKQGESREVAGAGPFTVVLGNPSAVDVLWKGKPVKLEAPNATTGVVRTTVGG